MKISQTDLATMAGRASTLLERFGAEFRPVDGPECVAAAEARLERWVRNVGVGDRERWKKRLVWDHLDEARALKLLGAVKMEEGVELPTWTSTLKEVLEELDPSLEEKLTREDPGTAHLLSPDAPVPFQELFLPFIGVARRRLRERAGPTYGHLTLQARADLERGLLKWLSYFSAPSLQLEFSIFLSVRRSSAFRRLARTGDPPSRVFYGEYTSNLKEGGLGGFFLEYAVLARMSVVLMEAWVDAMSEFLLRLTKDWPEIGEVFGNGAANPGSVEEIGPFLSDRHRGGQAVIRLTFSGGLKLIYKPRGMGSESAFGDLLDWVNARGAFPKLQRLKIVSRPGYGWVEHVDHEPTNDRSELQEYYRRAGMLLSLAYALHGYDLHFENVIASGSQPVVIDFETLMRPRPGADPNQKNDLGAYGLAKQMLLDSVLETGLLPWWHIGPNGESFDISGLGSVSDQETDFPHLDWQEVNTDAMALRYQQLKRPPSNNVPFTADKGYSPGQFVADIVLGFRSMYKLLIAERDESSDLEGCLRQVAQHEVRFVVRPTKAYGTLFMKTLRPTYMRDGADRSIELESLAQDLTRSESKPLLWPILEKEIRDLENLDIPYFSVLPKSRTLQVFPGRTINECFRESGFERVISRIQALDETDMERQVDLIRLSFHTRADPVSAAPRPGIRPEQSREAAPLLAAETAITTAIDIASDLKRRAIMAPDGSATWITAAPVPPSGRFRIEPMGLDLYGGVCGVALFLAALEKTTGGSGFRKLSLAALQPVRELVRHAGRARALAESAPIGGLTGIGAIVFTLVHVGRFLRDPDLTSDAVRAASLMTPGRIAADSELDIVSGAAGAILALLALYEASNDGSTLDQAVDCGLHLRANLVKTAGSDAGLSGKMEGVLLSGFSHGAAGMALALGQLHDATRDARFLDTAEELLAYERTLFCREKGNWKDLRKREDALREPSFMTTWCHGAPGIGLARLGGVSPTRSGPVPDEIEIALKTTRDFGLAGADSICCGSFGRIEFLWTAGHRLGRPDLANLALRQAASLTRRAKESGSFHLVTALPEGAYSPGFFQGASGIGYQLLRLADPGSIPSVLLMENGAQSPGSSLASKPGPGPAVTCGRYPG